MAVTTACTRQPFGTSGRHRLSADAHWHRKRACPVTAEVGANPGPEDRFAGGRIRGRRLLHAHQPERWGYGGIMIKPAG
jgi:hypothetical protein